MYLSKMKIVFVKIDECFCPNLERVLLKLYLSKLMNVFVLIDECICPNFKCNLPKLNSSKSNLGICGRLERELGSSQGLWGTICTIDVHLTFHIIQMHFNI